MTLHKGTGEEPCKPMRGLLDRAADGRARGLRAWYARSHAALCPGCGKYLRTLSEMTRRLAAAREATTDADAIERLSRRL